MTVPGVAPPAMPPFDAQRQRPTNVRALVVIVATMASVLLYLDRFCISVVTPEIQRDLGLSTGEVGWVLSAFFWSYGLAQVPSGWLSDRYGRRTMMVIYIVAWSAMTAWTGLAAGFVSLMALRLGFGVAQAGAYPTCSAMLSRWVPLEARGLASSTVALGGRMGGAIAPYLTTSMILSLTPLVLLLAASSGGWVSANVVRWLSDEWRPVLVIYGLAGLAVAALVWHVFRDRPQEHPACNTAEQQLITAGRPIDATQPPAGETASLARGLLTDRSMWLMCVSQWGTNIGWAFLVTWLPTYLAEAQKVYDLGRRGFLSSIPLLVGMAGLLMGGYVTDWARRHWGLRWGRSLPLAISRFMAAGAYLGFLAVDSPVLACVAAALIAFSTDLGVAATWAFTQDVGGRHVGSVLGWGNMWGNLGAAMSPLLLGWVQQKWDVNRDWHESFLVCAACFLVSGVASLGIDATRQVVPAEARRHVDDYV